MTPPGTPGYRARVSPCPPSARAGLGGPRLPLPGEPPGSGAGWQRPAGAGPGRAAEGRALGAGAARHRPGPAAAGSRQIRVSWRGLTCEPARSSGAEPRGRLCQPGRPAPLPSRAARSSAPRPRDGGRSTVSGGRRGGAGEGAGRPRSGTAGRVSADTAACPSVRQARSGAVRPGGWPRSLERPRWGLQA